MVVRGLVAQVGFMHLISIKSPATTDMFKAVFEKTLSLVPEEMVAINVSVVLFFLMYMLQASAVPAVPE